MIGKRKRKDEVGAAGGVEGHQTEAVREVGRAREPARFRGAALLAVTLAATAAAAGGERASAQEFDARDVIRVARGGVDGYQRDRQLGSRAESIEARRDQIARDIAATRAELSMFEAYRTGGHIPTEQTYTVTLSGGQTEVQILTGSRQLAEYRQRMAEARVARDTARAEIQANARLTEPERASRLAMADARFESVRQGVQQSIGERMHSLTARISALEEQRRQLGVERGNVQLDRVEQGFRLAERLAGYLD